MTRSAIVLAVALLTGVPVVIPVCGLPWEPTATVEDGALPSPTRRPTPRPGARFMGLATWYRWRPGEAAAGPLLRRAIPDWRGAKVKVCSSGRCVVVRLTDWCACGSRNGTPTVIDLDLESFRSLAVPSRGVIQVEVVGG